MLQVKAEDQGVPVRSAIAYVYITLTDANNKLPKFQSDLYVQYMNEGRLHNPYISIYKYLPHV